MVVPHTLRLGVVISRLLFKGPILSEVLEMIFLTFTWPSHTDQKNCPQRPSFTPPPISICGNFGQLIFQPQKHKFTLSQERVIISRPTTSTTVELDSSTCKCRCQTQTIKALSKSTRWTRSSLTVLSSLR
jgi:hypothetical protein